MNNNGELVGSQSSEVRRQWRASFGYGRGTGFLKRLKKFGICPELFGKGPPPRDPMHTKQNLRPKAARPEHDEGSSGTRAKTVPNPGTATGQLEVGKLQAFLVPPVFRETAH